MSHTSSKCENTLFIDVVLGQYWWKEPKMYITLFDSCSSSIQPFTRQHQHFIHVQN